MLSCQLDFIPNLKNRAAIVPFGDETRYSEPAVIASITANVNNETTNYVADMFKDDNNFPPASRGTW